MLIGICGNKGTGKDTVARILWEDFSIMRASFADPLKNTCKDLFQLTEDQVNGTIEQKETVDSFWGITPREILQRVGTELFRDNFDKDFWIKVAQRGLEDYNPSEDAISFSDVRFQNEVDFIYANGGFIIALHREAAVTNEFSTHSSEQTFDLKFYDAHTIFIHNNGTLEGLKLSVREAMEYFHDVEAGEKESSSGSTSNTDANTATTSE